MKQVVNGKVLEFLNDPEALPLLRRALRNPERSKYVGVTFEQFAEVAREAGYDDPEVLSLAYEAFRTVALLPSDELLGLILRLEGARRYA